jgi:GT2 family glycosyltransferase
MPALPPCDEPELSVVMVTHGGWQLTRRAIGALVDHTSRPMELVVVDNASPDETLSELNRIENVRVTPNDANHGFGPAVNQAAAQARGEYLVLLNTDAFVHPGWAEPLLAALARPRAGAAVPRYLNPDGSLQEAGVLLARDGTVRVYGDGDDPERPWYRFRRTVDYGSAVCMVIRAATFLGLGGFDDVYAPAYYEDTDLCMRMAEDGLEVVYEPRATVTHVRYGSGGAELASELSERNRERFAERWKSHLSGRPATFAGSSVQSEIAARDAASIPRVLILASGQEVGAGQVAGALVDGWPRARVTWALGESSVDGFDPAPWRERGVEVVDGDDPAWLDDRLFHYDAIVSGGGLGVASGSMVARTQPQAPRIPLEQVAGPAGELNARLRSALAVAGVAPGSDISRRR